jgi:hypothetical protein
MGLSKLIRRTESKISRGVSKIVDRAPRIISQAGSFLSKAGGVAGQVAGIADKILTNPITEALVAANPELIPLYGGALGATKLVEQVGQGTRKAGSVARQVGNTLERNKTVGGAVQAGLGAYQAYGSPSFGDVRDTVSSVRNTSNPFTAGRIPDGAVRSGLVRGETLGPISQFRRPAETAAAMQFAG